MADPVTEILAAVAIHQPISPFALHTHCTAPLRELRPALKAALLAKMVEYDPDWNLRVVAQSPPAVIPLNAPGAGDPGISRCHPKSDQGSAQAPPPAPTAPASCASHPHLRTESQKRALRCAIQNELELLSGLVDALGTYLQHAKPRSDCKVHPVACALLRRAVLARREYEASDKWLLENPPRDSSR